jgi:hypothetical protein
MSSVSHEMHLALKGWACESHPSATRKARTPAPVAAHCPFCSISEDGQPQFVSHQIYDAADD